jgi:hypothetical protein
MFYYSVNDVDFILQKMMNVCTHGMQHNYLCNPHAEHISCKFLSRILAPVFLNWSFTFDSYYVTFIIIIIINEGIDDITLFTRINHCLILFYLVKTSVYEIKTGKG